MRLWPSPHAHSFAVSCLVYFFWHFHGFHAPSYRELLHRFLFLKNLSASSCNSFLVARGVPRFVLPGSYGYAYCCANVRRRLPFFAFRMFASCAGIQSQVELACEALKDSPFASEDAFDRKLRALDIHWNPALVTDVIKRLECPKLAYNYFIWLLEKDGYKATYIEYNALLQKLGFAQLFKYMRMLLHRMDETECPMSSATYTILIRSYGSAGRIHDACKTLLEMETSGAGPSIEAYNCLIESFMKLGRVNSARMMYKQMCHAGLLPNPFTVSIVVNGLCKARKLEEAETLLRHSPVANTVCYNALLNGLCQAGRTYEAFHIWDEMRNKGLHPDAYTYNTLILVCCKAGLLDMALKLYNDMIEKHISPDDFTRVILMVFLCKAGRVDEAIAILPSMVSEGCILTYKDFCALRSAFSRTNLSSAAEALLLQIIRT